MRHLISALLLTVASPAMAQTYGGGGISLSQTTLDWNVPRQVGPNALGCLGALGYGVKNGRRAGGEAQLCGGPYANLAWAGGNFGIQSKRAGVWATLNNTVGGGWVGVHGRGGSQGRFDALYLFTRPAVGGGFALGGWAGLEGSVFVNLPVNVLGVASGDVDPKTFFPHIGLQGTLLFGDFKRQRKVRPEEQYRPPRPDYAPPPPPRRPPPPPARPARPEAPVQPGDLPRANERNDDRPLAIPGR